MTSSIAPRQESELPLHLVDRKPALANEPELIWFKKPKFWHFGLLLIGICSALILTQQLRSQGLPTGTGDNQTPRDSIQPIVALGRLTPAGELRTLAAPYAAGDARVAQILVKEGQWVEAGTLLVRFDNAPAMDAALKVAEQQLNSRRAALAQAQRTVGSNQEESAATFNRAEVAQSSAEAAFSRWAALADQGFISAFALDQHRAQRDEAVAEARRARAVQARHAGLGREQPELRVAQQAIELALSEIDRAKQDLDRANLYAPEDGTVIAISVRPGERPTTSGVLVFGNTQVMAAEVEIYQADIAKVAVGQLVTLNSPALTEPLHGLVNRVGLNVGRQRLTDTSPAANTDARVITITVTLDKTSSVRAKGLVGLEVHARIQTARPSQ